MCYCSLFVRAKVHICVVDLPYLSYVYRKKRLPSYHHHCTLYFALVFLEEVARFHEKNLGGVMKSREDIIVGSLILVRY
jgi:hypothetical protein